MRLTLICGTIGNKNDKKRAVAQMTESSSVILYDSSFSYHRINQLTGFYRLYCRPCGVIFHTIHSLVRSDLNKVFIFSFQILESFISNTCPLNNHWFCSLKFRRSQSISNFISCCLDCLLLPSCFKLLFACSQFVDCSCFRIDFERFTLNQKERLLHIYS